MTKPTPTYLLLTDSPPVQRMSGGCSILARNLLHGLRDDFGMVITHPWRPEITWDSVGRDVSQSVVLFPDGSRRWLRLCLPVPRPMADHLLFLLWLPWLVWQARRSGCKRVFALFGGDASFLRKVDLFRRLSGLPLDVYLVDDLEETCRVLGEEAKARLTRRLEPELLRAAARTFVVSPGYAEHLSQKYGQPATWLPLPVNAPPAVHTPYRPTTPDRRPLVFVGSMNALYLDALLDIYQEIKAWNARPDRPYALFLRLYTLATLNPPEKLLDSLDDHDDLEVHLNLDADALADGLRAAWAILLPYSFREEMRLMVTCSFSHKFTESIAAGRPILAYGPAYASIPRYFREEDLPLCATSRAQLPQALADIAAHDGGELVQRYAAVARRNHSPAALHAILEPAAGR